MVTPNLTVDARQLESAGIFSSDPIPALYQTGYLTIRGYDPVFRTYTLDYPNNEVREGFLSFLVPYYVRPEGTKGSFSIKRMRGAPDRRVTHADK